MERLGIPIASKHSEQVYGIEIWLMFSEMEDPVDGGGGGGIVRMCDFTLCGLFPT